MDTSVYEFAVGDFKCVAISDGTQPIDAETLPTFFAGAPADVLAEALRRHGLSPDCHELECCPLLIDTGSERVLIDSGGGSVFHAHLGKVISGLAAAGYRPGDIDIIVLTHGHLDHVCGGVDKNGEMVFPNARQLMARGEWAYWIEETDATAMGDHLVEDVQFAQDCLRGDAQSGGADRTWRRGRARHPRDCDAGSYARSYFSGSHIGRAPPALCCRYDGPADSH